MSESLTTATDYAVEIVSETRPLERATLLERLTYGNEFWTDVVIYLLRTLRPQEIRQMMIFITEEEMYSALADMID